MIHLYSMSFSNQGVSIIFDLHLTNSVPSFLAAQRAIHLLIKLVIHGNVLFILHPKAT